MAAHRSRLRPASAFCARPPARKTKRASGSSARRQRREVAVQLRHRRPLARKIPTCLARQPPILLYHFAQNEVIFFSLLFARCLYRHKRVVATGCFKEKLSSTPEVAKSPLCALALCLQSQAITAVAERPLLPDNGAAETEDLGRRRDVHEAARGGVDAKKVRHEGCGSASLGAGVAFRADVRGTSNPLTQLRTVFAEICLLDV